MTQLTALVAELRKEVCNLETSIEDEEDRAPSVRARIFHAPRPIVAHLRARRDNLLLTTLNPGKPVERAHQPARRRHSHPPPSPPPPTPTLERGMVEINRRLLSINRSAYAKGQRRSADVGGTATDQPAFFSITQVSASRKATVASRPIPSYSSSAAHLG